MSPPWIGSNGAVNANVPWSLDDVELGYHFHFVMVR